MITVGIRGQQAVWWLRTCLQHRCQAVGAPSHNAGWKSLALCQTSAFPRVFIATGNVINRKIACMNCHLISDADRPCCLCFSSQTPGSVSVVFTIPASFHFQCLWVFLCTPSRIPSLGHSFWRDMVPCSKILNRSLLPKGKALTLYLMSHLYTACSRPLVTASCPTLLLWKPDQRACGPSEPQPTSSLLRVSSPG